MIWQSVRDPSLYLVPYKLTRLAVQYKGVDGAATEVVGGRRLDTILNTKEQVAVELRPNGDWMRIKWWNREPDGLHIRPSEILEGRPEVE